MRFLRTLATKAAALAAALLIASQLAHAQQAQMLLPEPYEFRNLLICGDATTCPNQRGTSNVGGNIANSSTMVGDFWDCVAGASSSLNFSVVTPATTVVGSTKAYQMQRTNTNTNTAVLNCGQVLDTDRSTSLQGKTVAFSLQTLVSALGGSGFSPTGGNYTITVTAGTGTAQGYGSMVAGTWTGTSTVCTLTVAATTLPQQQFCVGQEPSNEVETGINISWTPVGTAGASDFLQFTQAQFEAVTPVQGQPKGPTPFEFHSTEVEFEMATVRAWVVNEPASGVKVATGGFLSTTTNCRLAMPFPQRMRAAPTLTASTITAGTTWKGLSNAASNISAIVVSTAHTQINASMDITYSTAQTAVGQGCDLEGLGGGATLTFSADLTDASDFIANDNDARQAA